LANLAALARDEEAYWDTEIAHLIQPPATSHQPLILPLSVLTQAPPALARRLVRRAVEIIKGDLRGIDFRHIERVIEMARSTDGSDRMQAPGLDVCRSFDWLRFAPPGSWAPQEGFAVSLNVPGSVELPRSGARIVLQVLEKDAATRPCATVVNELDWQRLRTGEGAPSLELRNWRPGDQYRRVGRTNPEKVKFFFQEARVPLWERRYWPIITFHGQIVWSRRFGAAAEFARGPETGTILQVAETGP
jgi:tRNA(Ile)-lysidine synthase